MVLRGAPLHVVQRILGHAKLETTAIYAKVDTSSLRSLAQPWPESLGC